MYTNIDPCGTPEVTLVHADGHPLHTTCCCRSFRKALIHLCNSPLTPMWSSFRSSLWCKTESKALVKSRKMTCELAPRLHCCIWICNFYLHSTSQTDLDYWYYGTDWEGPVPLQDDEATVSVEELPVRGRTINPQGSHSAPRPIVLMIGWFIVSVFQSCLYMNYVSTLHRNHCSCMLKPRVNTLIKSGL